MNASPRLESQISSQTSLPICIISWNSRRSSKQKLQLMNKLVSQEIVGEKIPILCNQENFILKANLYRLYQEVPGFHFFVNPAIKETQDIGRPKNGMFICVPDRIKNCVSDVSPGHWRIQAVIISREDTKTLVINSYFPYDERQSEDDSHELDETNCVIRNVIRSCDCDAVILAGDINADLTRNTHHTRTVRASTDELQLVTAWDTYQVDFHPHLREGGRHLRLHLGPLLHDEGHPTDCSGRWSYSRS